MSRRRLLEFAPGCFAFEGERYTDRRGSAWELAGSGAFECSSEGFWVLVPPPRPRELRDRPLPAPERTRRRDF